MILLINKYHRTANGETASAEKIEKTDEVECYRKAYKEASQYEANYYADTTVLDFSVSIFNPKTATVVRHTEYVTPIVVTEKQTETLE